MNKCIFLGRLTHKPVIDIDANSGTPRLVFELEVEEFRRDKNGNKKRILTVLEFEAWDTAALTIEKYANEGVLMSVESSARSHYTEEHDYDLFYFRVTSFKILS